MLYGGRKMSDVKKSGLDKTTVKDNEKYIANRG